MANTNGPYQPPTDVLIYREVEFQTLVHLQSSHHSTPPSFRLWPMLLLPCLRSVSRTPTATCWTSILRTSTSCWRPSTSARSGDRSSSWTACPTTTPRMSARPKGTAVAPSKVFECRLVINWFDHHIRYWWLKRWWLLIFICFNSYKIY